jgi:CMP-N-acetylneuraminic acid synthetase
MQWTIESAKASQLTRVVVSTDDEEIAALAMSFGVALPELRPSNLASDTAKTIDAVLHALKSLTETYDAVMVLQPTSPFRTSDDVNNCLSLLENSDADSVISVVDVGGHHPARMKFLEDGLLIDPPFAEKFENQPRQELSPMFIRNGAIYLTRVHVLHQGSFKGTKSLGYVMPAERSINIDEPLDLRIASAMVNV